MDEIRETKSVRNMKDSVWKKAMEYRIRYNYENMADFLEQAIENYCKKLDSEKV